MSDVDLMFRAQLDGSGFSSGASGIISQLGMMGSAAGAATVAVAALAAAVAGIGAVIVGSTMAFSAFQQSAADLNKIMGGTADQQKTIADNMRQMSVESGTAVTQLLGVAASLSALGIETQNLTSATEVINQMGIALGLSNDEAASYMAGLNTLYGTSVENWSRIASGINEVENSTSATSKGMLNFANEFAPLAKQFNVTDKEALALGSTFEALKIPTEQAATSLRSAFMVASADPKKMTAWSELMGISVKDLTNSLDRDFIGTMLKSAAAINEIESGSEKAAKTHEIWGSYGMQSIALLGDQTATYTENLNTLNQAYEENTSIAQEVETRNNTLLGSWNKAKAAINDLGITIGETTQGPIKGILDGFTAMYPALQQGVQSLMSGDFSGIGDFISQIGSKIADYFRSLDYTSIGYKLRDTLISAWDFAVGLFKSALGQGDSIVGAFSALGDILRPTFEHIFSSLQIAGLKAAMAIGEAMTSLANTIGSAFTTAINWVLDQLANLADAIDAVTGGAVSKLTSIGSMGGSPTTRLGDVTNIKQIVPEGTYTIGEKTWSGADIIDQWSSKSEKQAMIDKYDVVRIASAAGSESAIQTLRTQSVVNEMYTPLPDGTESVDIWGGKAPATSKPPSDEEIAMHERGTDTLANLITESSDIQGKAGEAIRALKTTYVDNQPFAESDKGKLIQSQIDLLEAQKAAERTLKENGLEDTKAAEELQNAIEATTENAAAAVVAAVTGIQTPAPGMYSGTSGESTNWQSYYNPATGGFAGPTALYDEFVQWKALLELQSIEAERNVEAINSVVAAYREGNISLDEAISQVQNMGQETTAVADSFSQATSEADNLKSTCVEVEFSMENIAAKASQIQFSRSASASPDALKQGIFETSAGNPLTSQPQMAGGASQGLSNAALSAMQRYLSQIASSATQINNGITTYGRSIFTAVQTAGTNAAAAVNANGSIINSSVNSQGGAIVGAINAGVAAIVKAVGKSKGGGGGGTMFPGSLSSGGGFWSGWAGDAGTMSYSTGGYASHPTLAIVGDSPGGEFMVPRDRVGEFVNSYMAHQQTKIDGSGMRSQLMDAIGSLNVPAIHIPVVVDIDSEAIFEAVEYAFKSISSDIRLRARV